MRKEKTVKVAVSGGGTGGHILPVLAVIKSIKKENPSGKICFIGSRFGMESKLIPKMGIKYYGVSTGKFRRYHKSKILNLIDPTTIYHNAKDFFGFFKGIFEARNILKHESPDVLFAKGGFVSLPVGIAAWTLKIPVVIHESDSIMGMANKIMAKFAAKVCVSFPVEYYEEQVKQEKLFKTGNPVREDILGGMGDRFLVENGLAKDKKTILVLGGSQGSRLINTLIVDILIELPEDVQVLWIAGDREAELINYQLSDFEPRVKDRVRVFGFVSSEMGDIYDAADLVIARAGSNVLFELAAIGKPAILIPLEIAGGHQVENAKIFSRAGAAYMIRQIGLTPKKLLHQINYLINNEEELTSLSNGMKKLADLKSSDEVALVITDQAKKKDNEQTREN
jgi:UDP-N-acetylglucosamine--N-acetylmuramyl-(pentapeptide) pyrophosphoryl-undecaprenol N-acetylglucosamine transferase